MLLVFQALKALLVLKDHKDQQVNEGPEGGTSLSHGRQKPNGIATG